MLINKMFIYIGLLLSEIFLNNEGVKLFLFSIYAVVLPELLNIKCQYHLLYKRY